MSAQHENKPKTQEASKPPVNVEAIKAFLKDRKTARLKMWMEACAHCALCADTCHYYLAHDRDPKMIPSYKVRMLTDLYKKKGEVDEAFLDECYKRAFHECTMCRRCTLFCPFGIDMATMISTLRSLLTTVGRAPKGLAAAIENYLASGNQMAVTEEEWVDTIQWMEEELQEEIKGATIPINKKGARIMYTVNAREPKFYPMDIQLAAKIFNVAGEDWTVPTYGWDDTNLAMFAGDTKTARFIVEQTFKAADELEVEYVAITECGHAYRAVKWEAPAWMGRQPKQKVIHSVELFAEYLRDGRIKIDPDKKITEPVTYQDPCNVSRSGGLEEEARYIISRLCTDFRDMNPHGNLNFCCGGGGGAMPMGGEMRKGRLKSGKVKADQIRATGAKLLIVPCHNCFDQINDLKNEYALDIKVVQFKELISEAMIIPPEMVPSEEDEE